MGGLDLIMTCYGEVSDQQFYEKRGTDEVLLGFVIHAPVPTTPMLFVTTIGLEFLPAAAVSSASSASSMRGDSHMLISITPRFQIILTAFMALP
jgi:hypothetical protein